MLEGDLRDFTLPDILRLLAVTSKTGRLRVEDDGEAGRIDVVNGHVVDASADADRLPLARRLLGLGILDGTALRDLFGEAGVPTDLEFARAALHAGVIAEDRITALLREQTVDALFDLLRWDVGSFRFEIAERRDGGPPQLDLTVGDLLDEVEQRLAEWPTIEERTGATDAIVSITGPAEARGQGVHLGPEGWALLRYVDGRRTVADLVALSGRGRFDTRRTLGTLVDAGVVRVGDTGGDVQRLLDAHRALAELEASRRGDGHPAGAAVPDTVPDAPAPAPAMTSKPPAPVAADDSYLDVEEPAEREPDAETVTPLRTRVRPNRLTTDPAVDADLVGRLIEGVEGL